MAKRIEEAFNDCFERLTYGESLDSCLTSYPEFAFELDAMLRTAFDIKRRAYPVQPRPEFKYWSRVRLQGVQDYVSRQPAQDKPGSFNLRRNLAFSMAALLVFVIATSGTAAASSEAQPDEPLYGVKMAVEQAQVTFAFSDVDKAEVYAHLAEKRAGEIVAMARQGKVDKVVTTTAKMNYQLDQAEQFISKYAEANADADDSASTTTSVSPAPVVPPASTATSVAPAPVVPPAPTATSVTTAPVVPPAPTATSVTTAPVVPPAPTATSITPAPVVPPAPTATSITPAPVVPPAPTATITTDKNTSASTTPVGQQDNFTLPSKPVLPATRAATNINRAKNTINASTAKSLAILQNALEKAPDSTKPALQEVIQRTKKANERAQQQLNLGSNQKLPPPVIRPNIIPAVPPDKPKYLPPFNNNLRPNEPRPFNKPNSQNLLPQSGVNNQTDNIDDDDKNIQTPPASNLRSQDSVDSPVK